MRDLFEDIFANQPLDATEAARKGARPRLSKRFYKSAQVGESSSDGVSVLLDGKPLRTPARRPFATPTRALAEKIAQEWEAQRDLIDPAAMPLTRLANAVIDAVADQRAAVTDEIAKYLGSDLLCYRAEAPEGLVARQAQAWDPVLVWARDALGARFVLAAGVRHVEQPPEAIAAACAAIPSDANNLTEIWRLGAMASIVTLTGSALLGLALARDAIGAEAAWAAAHVDEDWQMAQWGRDEVALARRSYRRGEFDAAVAVLQLTRYA